MTLDIEIMGKEICQFVTENLIAEGVEIKPQTSLSAIGLDSFSIIEIVLFIERKYGIALPDEALSAENIESVYTLANCALNYQAQS